MMKDGRQWNPTILAVVTQDRNAFGGGLPIVFANSEEEQAALAQDLGRILRADVHRLSNGSYVLLETRR